MKRTLILIACTLVVGAFAAVAAESPAEPAAPAAQPSQSADTPADLPAPDLFTPAPERKDPCHRCFGLTRTTSPGGGAASHWGMGSSCGAAHTDLVNQLSNAAGGICVDDGALGACALTVVVTGSCFWNGSMYQEDGYADFKCMQYIC